MLANIFLFEIQQRLRRLSTYVYFVVFFALGLLFVLMSGGAFANASVDFGTGGKVLITSPYALNGVITFICFFGIVITAAIAGQATYQDIDSNSAVFFYTAPITKFDYLGGRFLAAFAIQVLIFSSVGLGAWIGTLTPWLDKTRVGPQMVGAYFQPYFINVLPNLLFLTAIFFALSTLSRKMLPVYVASVLVLIGYFTVGQLNNTTLTASVRAALADPLGGAPPRLSLAREGVWLGHGMAVDGAIGSPQVARLHPRWSPRRGRHGRRAATRALSAYRHRRHRRPAH